MNVSLALQIIIPLILLVVGVALTLVIFKVVKIKQTQKEVVVTENNVVEISNEGNIGLKHFAKNLNSFEKVFFNSGIIVAVAVWLMNTLG